MAKQPRIEFAGAFYHVTSRGNRKQPIFLSDEDRYFFLNCLREAHERFGVIAHAYCLMGNHYHLFLETPRGNLSRIMHLINLKYSSYFNQKHSHEGHTFQARFRATLVQAAEYAREVASYVHLNPVRAGLVARPEDYEWSNYREYMGLASPVPWTSNSFVLRLFGTCLSEARQAYEGHILLRMSQGFPNPFESAKATGILAKPEFIENIRRSMPATSGVLSKPDFLGVGASLPSLAQVQTLTDAVLGRESSLSRKIAIHISHTTTGHSLRSIGEFFGIGESGIADICRRTRKELIHNETLARIIGEIVIRLRRECQSVKEGTGSSQG